MTAIGPFGAAAHAPYACSLALGAGREQVERWRAFDRAHARSRVLTPGLLTVRYEKTAETAAELRALVATESVCCSFAAWSVDEAQPELVLEVRGTDEALSMLNIR